MISSQYTYKGIRFRLLSIKEAESCRSLTISQIMTLIYNNCFVDNVDNKVWFTVRTIMHFIFYRALFIIKQHLLEDGEFEFFLSENLYQSHFLNFNDSVILAICSVIPSLNPLELENESFETIMKLYYYADEIFRKQNNRNLLQLREMLQVGSNYRNNILDSGLRINRNEFL